MTGEQTTVWSEEKAALIGLRCLEIHKELDRTKTCIDAGEFRAALGLLDLAMSRIRSLEQIAEDANV